jgi:restriction system protein
VGGINFGPRSLADCLSETAGFKAGLALSVEELCDHLSGTDYPDIIVRSEEFGVRLRSDEYEELFYKLLHRIGYTKEEYDGDYAGVKRVHKYRRKNLLTEYEGMLTIFSEMWMRMLESAEANGSRKMDPTPFILKCHERYGDIGLEMAIEQIEVMYRAVTLSPHSIGRSTEWTNPLSLAKLFQGTAERPEQGRYIDQRFINYLCQNPDRMQEMHWRKFEELTAEFFDREGYQVELGPGGNDDGVDVRVWKADASPSETPLCLVQCKRQKAKVDRVVVKGLHSDVEFEGAEFGVLVTTSELSPAARNTISARGYSIRDVDQNGLREWLTKLRSPGTGIVRI